MKTVIFVSDSDVDAYNDRALIGTEAYRVFLEYLHVLDLSINDTLLYNEKDSRKIEAIAVADPDVRVITLGARAQEAMESLNVPYFALPHLERNTTPLRSLNFESVLNDCKDYVHDSRAH